MNTGGVPEPVLGSDCQVDRRIDVRDPRDRHDRHHLLGPHQRMLDGHLGHDQTHVVGNGHADLRQDLGGVLTDPGRVDSSRLAR